jgi:hypothetical protein
MAALDAPVRSARSPRGEEAADLMKIAADLMKIANLQLGVSFKYRRSSGLKVSTQQEYASRWSTVQTQSTCRLLFIH